MLNAAISWMQNWCFDSDITEDTALCNAMTSDYSTYGMTMNAVALFEQRETENFAENYKP